MGSTVADAKTLVNDFKANPGGTDWLKIESDKLADGLIARLDAPNKISSAAVNLCGPAAFFRNLVVDDPVMYVRAAISLYRTNKGLLGSREFKASHTLRIADPGTTEGADWVLLASLRDDENTVLRYDDKEGGLSGLTMPSALEKWFKEAGYASVKNDTNVYFTKGIDHMKKASSLMGQSYRPCLLIHADMLSATKQGNRSIVPNHWVMMTKAATVADDDTISFKVFTWGQDRAVPLTGKLPVPDFEKNYYGYVAVKYVT